VTNESVSLMVERAPCGDGVVVLTLSGELVVTSREVLRQSAESEFESGARGIVVAVSQLTHIDTSGLALLVGLAVRCAERGGRLAVAGLKRDVQEMRQHLFLDEALLFSDNVEDAVAAVSSVV
jgi:anti-sigma B factor antagonist